MENKKKRSERKLLKLKPKRKTLQKESELNIESSFEDSEENLIQNQSYGTQVNLCRVCLNEGDIPIYGDESIADISASLSLYGAVKIQVDDDFPKHICHDCHEQLQSAIKFRQTAQETDQCLRGGYFSEDKKFEPILVLNEQSDDDDDDDGLEFFKETLADANTFYHCRMCKLDFQTSKEYGKHIFSNNHNNLKDKCPFCYRVYSCIQKHLSLHKVSETVLCTICGEKFLKPNFWRHKESHENVLPYKCAKCPYQGRYGGDFKIHMRKHTGERPYQCSKCNAGFISKSNLNRHLLTHKNYHEFYCDECNKGFDKQEKLDMHIKVNHVGIREHLCNLCGKSYGYRKVLMKHQLQVHKREKLRAGKLPVYLKFKTKNNETQETEMENN